ncbi:gluconolactonase [Rhodoligotrophos appendicifer]|uniref:SMP-30/gluconolactonase/LRE family protein n=1 Tax=Rhodoligotrophos appendicifer TaxID=987056 RepID=UPI0011870F17|nr:SMP-30/gluconolactonase/LRE family protein [Rhodoligotrophos appendicifer]
MTTSTRRLPLNGRVVATGLRFPEGPVALSDGSILVVEMAAGDLTRISPDGHKTVVAHVGGGPNGAAIGPDGHIYVCNNGGLTFIQGPDGRRRPTGGAPGHPDGSIQRVDLSTGKVETILTECDGQPLRGPNDIIFDGAGGFWFTDLGKVHETVIYRGAVYYARLDGSLIKRAIFPIFMPNGVGLSPDGRTLYVSETDTSRLWSWPIIGTGEVAKDPWPSPHGGKIVHGLPGYSRFDSLAVEEAGNICIATLVTGGVAVVTPNGDLAEFHEAPEPYSTNICFGGSDLRTAFITLSGTGILLAADWPRPGLRLQNS